MYSWIRKTKIQGQSSFAFQGGFRNHLDPWNIWRRVPDLGVGVQPLNGKYFVSHQIYSHWFKILSEMVTPSLPWAGKPFPWRNYSQNSTLISSGTTWGSHPVPFSLGEDPYSHLDPCPWNFGNFGEWEGPCWSNWKSCLDQDCWSWNSHQLQWGKTGI